MCGTIKRINFRGAHVSIAQRMPRECKYSVNIVIYIVWTSLIVYSEDKHAAQTKTPRRG